MPHDNIFSSCLTDAVSSGYAVHLVCDFDGTLAEIVSDALSARLVPDAINAVTSLDSLASSGMNISFRFLSGRDIEEFDQLIKASYEDMGLEAQVFSGGFSHGLIDRDGAGNVYIPELPHEEKDFITRAHTAILNLTKKIFEEIPDPGQMADLKTFEAGINLRRLFENPETRESAQGFERIAIQLFERLLGEAPNLPGTENSAFELHQEIFHPSIRTTRGDKGSAMTRLIQQIRCTSNDNTKVMVFFACDSVAGTDGDAIKALRKITALSNGHVEGRVIQVLDRPNNNRKPLPDVADFIFDNPVAFGLALCKVADSLNTFLAYTQSTENA